MFENKTHKPYIVIACYYYYYYSYYYFGSGWLSQYSDMLRTGQSGVRILVEARFSAPVQSSHVAHPAPYVYSVYWIITGAKAAGAWL
jgi:hypothetical protein